MNEGNTDYIIKKLKENETNMEKKYKIKYPIRQRGFVKGPEKVYSVPYSPIYSVPINKESFSWELSKQDSEQELYFKVHDMCNLYLTHRHILYMDCSSFKLLKEEDIKRIQYTTYKFNNQYVDKEHARCQNIADQIWKNTINKYSEFYAGTKIYSYSFKYYIPQDKWYYFCLSPFLYITYSEICKVIHNTYRIFYTIIIFALDDKGLPYMEVLISNRTKKELGYFDKVCLSNDPSDDMISSVDKLTDLFNLGLRQGRNIILNIISKHPDGIYEYPIMNDPEVYKRYAYPTIGDLM